MYQTYVIACHSDNEYDDSVTHVAFPLRPSLVLRLAWHSLLVNLIGRLVRRMNFYSMEVSFRETTWLNLNSIDGGFHPAWEQGVILEALRPDIPTERVDARSVKLYGPTLCFISYGHHSGTEFTSNEISLGELWFAIRWRDVVTELREWINPKAA
jgi:hypothetical protein